VVPEAGDSPVSALVEVEDGLLAVGTSDGVLLLRADHVAERLTQREGLSCDVVTALARGRGGRLLIGTQGGGLCQYDGHVIQNLQVPGRVGANVVNAVCEDDEGVIWIGTAGGLVRYAPRWSVPAVGIEGVTTDRTYRPEAQVEVAAPAGRARFEFRGVSPHEPAEYLVYRHRLVGHAAAWQCTHERYAEYEGLRPGDCVFEVQAVDRDLRYSPVARLELRIVEDPRVAALTAVLSSEGAKGEFIGESASLRRVLQQLREVASTELTVLVTGETGTGKGLAARAIHQLSARRHGPFIHVNCGGLQAQLIESDLFGHERGAFTGAVARRLGKFELADGGTIFLDEIGDLSADCQTRLLHVLQERVIERVGSQKSVSVDVRVIAATNRDLARAVRQNQFRADLFYRLNVFPVVLPPLRDRREDVPLLAQHFVRQFSAHLHRPPPVLTDAAMVRLLEYSWPGNVRELEHTIQRAVILSDSTSIGPEHIVLGPMPPAQQQEQNLEILPLEEFERRYLQRVLEHTGGVIHGRRGAALLLGVKPTTLRSRLQRLGLR